MNNLSLVTIQNGLAQDVKRVEIKTKIITRINELNLNLADYRMNNEMLLLVLNLIEHLVTKKSKINKKLLAVEILEHLFGLNTTEKQNVESNIEFLFENKNIKKVSKWKLFKAGICELFFKKKD